MLRKAATGREACDPRKQHPFPQIAVLLVPRPHDKMLLWGAPPGPRGTPRSRFLKSLLASNRPTRGSAADRGVRPTKETRYPVKALEHSGYGAKAAAPIARKLMDAAQEPESRIRKATNMPRKAATGREARPTTCNILVLQCRTGLLACHPRKQHSFPQIAVVVEHGGYGAKAAAPIARQGIIAAP